MAKTICTSSTTIDIGLKIRLLPIGTQFNLFYVSGVKLPMFIYF